MLEFPAVEWHVGSNAAFKIHYPQVTLAAEAPVLFLFRKDLVGKREGGAVLNREVTLPVSESSRAQKKLL